MTSNTRTDTTVAEPKYELIVQPCTQEYWLDDQRHAIVRESDWKYCARSITRHVELPFFFSPGIGVVVVGENPPFLRGFYMSPVSLAELEEILRHEVRFLRLHVRRGTSSLSDVDLYNRIAKLLAGTRKSNPYFPELKGMVFVGHRTSDGRVIKRSGFDRRTGLYAVSRKPFLAANDESMEVAA